MAVKSGPFGGGNIVVGTAVLAGLLASVLSGSGARGQQPKTGSPPAAAAADKQSGDPAVQRARRQVLMLDDLYKTVVVLVTDKYVHSDKDVSAGSAAQLLFEAMRKKGHHDVRLLDATGEPYDDDNLPKDDFEKEAIRALKAGQPAFEKVEQREGGRVFRMATPVPVVMDKCVMCHEAYKSAKKNEAIGALSYTLRVE